MAKPCWVLFFVAIGSTSVMCLKPKSMKSCPGEVISSEIRPDGTVTCTYMATPTARKTVTKKL